MSLGFSEIIGGVTAPLGFTAAATCCGVQEQSKAAPDLALVASSVPAVAAATFPTNKIKAAPVRVSASHVRSGETRAIIINSGNANACTGSTGIQHAKRMAHGGDREGGW